MLIGDRQPSCLSILCVLFVSVPSVVTLVRPSSAHIIVATPGRLEDMFRRRQPGCDLVTAVKALVCAFSIARLIEVMSTLYQ